MMMRRLLFILCIWGQCGPAFAGSEVKHPVYNPALTDADCRKVVAGYSQLLALGDDPLLALVPDRAGFYLCGCPNCEGGASETSLEWNVYAPGQVHCKYCGTVYPNEKFPERYSVEVKTPDGRVHVYPYYKDAKGREYFFQARAWFERRRYLAGAAYDLAALYHATGEAAYAHRAALILAGFARVYPGYAVHFEDRFAPKQFFPADARPPFPPGHCQATKWSWWCFLEIPNNLILAYDLIYPSGEMEKLDARFGRPVKEMVEKDFLRVSVAYAMGYPEALHNMSPHIYQGLIIAGRVLGEPEWVEDGLTRTKRLLETRFYADGVWCEGSASYQRQVLDLLSLVFKAAKGYSDPSVGAIRESPLFNRATAAADELVLPDGHPVPLNDTWARVQGLPLLRSRPVLFPWFGYAILGHGNGADQVQAHLNWSAGYDHQHLDKLGFLLFAKGHELLSDIGCTHTSLRGWTTSTASHNTVMIDGKNQCPGSDSKLNGGDLLLYDARNEFVQVVEARVPKAYPGVATDYRRVLITIRVPPRDAYVVDVFTVAGGTQHDWLLHGSADEDMNAECALPLVDYPGTLLPDGAKFSTPENEMDESRRDKSFGFAQDRSLGFITNLRRATTDQTWSVDFVPKKSGNSGLRTTVLGAPGTEVFLGQAPSVRRAREDESLLEKYRMPVGVVRRNRASRSVFAAVHEPYESKPFISKIEPLNLGADTMALAVTHSQGIDYVMYSTDASAVRTCKVNGHELHFRGHVGVVRTTATGLEWMYMVDSSELQWDNHRAVSPGRCEGVISGAYAASEKIPAFCETPTQVADDPALKDAVMIVRHGDGSTHGQAVKGIVPVGERTWIFLAEAPGFTYDPAPSTTRIIHFPQNTITGQNSFVIPYAAFTRGAK